MSYARSTSTCSGRSCPTTWSTGHRSATSSTGPASVKAFRRERSDRQDASPSSRGFCRLRHHEESVHRGRQPRCAQVAPGVVPRQGQIDLYRSPVQHGQRLRVRRRLRGDVRLTTREVRADRRGRRAARSKHRGERAIPLGLARHDLSGLRLARSLLTEDGSYSCSCDFHESANFVSPRRGLR